MKRPARRKTQQRRYTIGITIFVNADGKLSLFENGLRQNVLFLYKMFLASPLCERVLLLNHGDGEPIDPMGEAGIDPAIIVRTPSVIDQLDFVVSIGAAMDPNSVAQLKQRGVPLVGYKCGNAGVISMEAMCAHPPRGDAEIYIDHDYFDAIWMTPQHIHTYKSWCETVYRCPVFEVPQVWDTDMMDSRPQAIRERLPYEPGQKGWRISVMDPNITVMKTSHLPMLVCEAAFRKAPELFDAFYITNGKRYSDNVHFVAFYRALSAAAAGKMTLEQRFVAADMLANHSDAVVTHHWENGLNYLYYEVLSQGYPLVHNSAFLKDYGYYYPDFDPEAGADALIAAFHEHDGNLFTYKSDVARLLGSLKPSAPDNIRLHEGLLFELARGKTA